MPRAPQPQNTLFAHRIRRKTGWIAFVTGILNQCFSPVGEGLSKILAPGTNPAVVGMEMTRVVRLKMGLAFWPQPLLGKTMNVARRTDVKKEYAHYHPVVWEPGKQMTTKSARNSETKTDCCAH